MTLLARTCLLPWSLLPTIRLIFDLHAYCRSFAQSEDGPLPGWHASLFYLLVLELQCISLADNVCIALLVLMLLADAEAFLIKNTCPSLRLRRLLWTCHSVGLPLEKCRKGEAEASGLMLTSIITVSHFFTPKELSAYCIHFLIISRIRLFHFTFYPSWTFH